MSSSENQTAQTQTNYRAHNLSGVSWANRVFSGGDFSQIQANDSQLTTVSFATSQFHAATVRNANWTENSFENCTGRFMEFENTTLTNSAFTNCRFEDGSFYEVNFENSTWIDSVANGCDFRYSSFRNATLRDVNLSNCDLAHVDFTGCQFENVNAYNARITNAIGLSDVQRDQLLAGGAYEGLPPSINKLRKRSLSLQRTLTTKVKGAAERLNPSTWIDTEALVTKAQETFQEWREERRKQREELQRQEELWKEEQEARRQKSIEERKIREERRRQEKEAQQAERVKLAKRRKQEQEIQTLLQSQQSERKQLEKDIQKFFTELEQRDSAPQHVENIGEEANALYQETEAALQIEQGLREQLQRSPLDEALRDALNTQIQKTQQLAEQALNIQQRYFNAVQEWKRKENEVLQQLQQEAIERSAQLLFENKQGLNADDTQPTDLQEKLSTLEAESHRNLLRAQLEYEQAALQDEKRELEQAVSDAMDTGIGIEEVLSDGPSNFTIDSSANESTAVLPEEPLESQHIVSEEYQSLYDRVTSWLWRPQPQVDAETTSETISGDIVHEDSIEFNKQECSSAEVDIFVDKVEEEFTKELERIEDTVEADSISTEMVQSLKTIQQASIREILQSNTEVSFLSENALKELQSKLITDSLLSFKHQLAAERQLTEEQRQLEEKRRSEQLQREEEQGKEQERLQQKERERQAKRAALAQERQAELEAQHKKQLQSIIESRYSKFAKDQRLSPEEQLEVFTPEDIQSATDRMQQIQRQSSEQTFRVFLEQEALQQKVLEQQALNAKERLEALEQKHAEEKRRQAEQEATQKRQREHRQKLQEQARKARQAALVEEQRRRERLLAEKEAKRIALAKQQQRALEEKEAKLRAQEERKQQALAEKERLKQQRLEEKREQEEKKRQQEERRRQERELKRLEQIEKEQQAQIERKRERLSLLKDQLLEEARRQEYQELSAQIEADIEVQQSQTLERQRKQEAFLSQVRAEQERRANDPLLLEQARQQELLLRKQERLHRLQEREREIQNALLQLQTEYEKDKVSAPTDDLKIQFQSPMQQRWYRFTDIVSAQSPALAQSLDAFKEQLEELYISRQAQARFSREQQKKLAEGALAEKRRLEHQERLRRLAEIRSKEERREARLLDEAEQRARKEAEAERQAQRLAMAHIDRHQVHQTEAMAVTDPLQLTEQDFRGEDHVAAEWARADIQRALLSGTRLEAGNLIEANLSLALLDYANLKGATLDGATLHKSNLEGANLQHASLQGSQLRLTRMYDADLRNVNAQGATFDAVDCTGSKGVGALFRDAILTRCTFVEMTLKSADFSGATITGGTFNRTDLTDAIFTGVNAKDADFRGARGLTKETLEYLNSVGALVDLNDAVDRYGTWGAPQLRAAVVLFVLGAGSLVLTKVLDNQATDLEALEAEAQALREEDAGLASERYEALAVSSQILDEQVQYYIESAILAEQNNDFERSQNLFETALVAADLNTELNTKVGLRFAQFLLTHSKPEGALTQLQQLMTYQSLSTFQRAKLIFYTEQACEILGENAEVELETFYASMNALPEVQADLHMALSDLRLQQGQTEAALEELQRAKDLNISDGLALRLIESTARAHDRLGNLNEAISAYEDLLSKAEPNGQTAQTATLAMADLWRREGNTSAAMTLLDSLSESAANDGRLRSRTLLIQGRILEEDGHINEASTKYKMVLSIDAVEPETREESRVSLARLLLQNDPSEIGDLPPEILIQAKLGEARTILDQGNFEEALDLYSTVLKTDTITDVIRRAAQSGMAEALSNLGKHQEANDIWETLLREKLDAVESQHIEILLAYSKLQANDIDGARLAFESLAQSNDSVIRYQGLMGSAQASVLSGELERAKEAYERILQNQPSEEIQIQVWQELAQIAQEQSAIEDVLLAWQNILRFGIDDEALRAEAHTSIARTLAQMDRLDEAIAECELNLSTPESQLQCAMIMEMAQDSRALERYQVIAQNERVSDALRSEAALGAAKLMKLTRRSDMCLLGLGLSQIDPTVELQLIQLYLETPNLDDMEQQKWQTRQTQLAEQSPQVLVQYLMERTSQLRAEQKLRAAIETMKLGVQGLPEEYAIPLRLELADMLLEVGEVQRATQAYQALLNASEDDRLVRSGLARTHMLQGEWGIAREVLQELDIDVITGTEIHMLMEINQEAPTAEGLELANRWASQASNPDVQWEALTTQAHKALSEDNTEQALQLFEEAVSIAVETRQKEWAQLGQAQVYRSIDQEDEALSILKRIENTEDAEILGQYHIEIAQTLRAMDKPEEALASLDEYTAVELGPGWDMTVEELRAQLYGSLNQFELAYQTLSSIEARWPNEEQVLIPSAIVKIQLLQQEGEVSEAQNIAQASLNVVEDPVYRSQIDDLITAMQ